MDFQIFTKKFQLFTKTIVEIKIKKGIGATESNLLILVVCYVPQLIIH